MNSQDLEKLNYWKQEVLTNYHYQCFITGSKNTKQTPLVCHHLESWDCNPKLRFDIQNGIVLEKAIHKKFHDEYGFGKNTILQFERFCLEHYKITHFPWKNDNPEPSFTINEYKEKILLKKEQLQKKLEKTVFRRGHQLLFGTYQNCKSPIKVYCLIHKDQMVTTYHNYMKSKYGCICCARQKQSEGTRKNNFLRKIKKKL